MSYSSHCYPRKNYKLRLSEGLEPLSKEAQEEIFLNKADMMDYSDPVGNLRQLLASPESASNHIPMKEE